jgi:hypothetical protein
MGPKRGTRQALGGALVVTLTLTGCATSRRGSGQAVHDGAVAHEAADVARQCGDFAKRLDYAGKSVAGRAAEAVLLRLRSFA